MKYLVSIMMLIFFSSNAIASVPEGFFGKLARLVNLYVQFDSLSNARLTINYLISRTTETQMAPAP